MQNAREAAIVKGIDVYGIKHLKDVTDFFIGKKNLCPLVVDARKEFQERVNNWDTDFADVRGQENVKRALEIIILLFSNFF